MMRALARMGPFIRANAIRSAVIGASMGGLHAGPAYLDLRGQLPQRGEWPTRDMDKVDGIVIHHSATTGQTLRSMAEFHAFVKGWQGLSYHYAVGWDGTVYLCNDVDRLTWHVENNNTRNIGIVLVGNLERNPVPDAQREAVRNLVYYLRELHAINKVLPHRAYKTTACPGQNAVDALEGLWVDG